MALMICVPSQIYLTEGNQFKNDVKLVEGANGTRHIAAARFLIQGAYIMNAVEEKIFLEELRDVTHASKFNITVFHPYFMYFDQVRRRSALFKRLRYNCAENESRARGCTVNRQ